MADVFEQDAARLHVGQKARLELAVVPGRALRRDASSSSTRRCRRRRERSRFGSSSRTETAPAASSCGPACTATCRSTLPAATGLVVPAEALVDTGEHAVRVRGDGRRPLRAALGDGRRAHEPTRSQILERRLPRARPSSRPATSWSTRRAACARRSRGTRRPRPVAASSAPIARATSTRGSSPTRRRHAARARCSTGAWGRWSRTARTPSRSPGSRSPPWSNASSSSARATGCWSCCGGRRSPVGAVVAMRSAKLDAIPDLSDPQVIVFTEWMGRSPTLVEDQVTYPIVSKLIGDAARHRRARLLDVRDVVRLRRLRGGHRRLLGAQPRARVPERPARQRCPRASSPTLGPGRDRHRLGLPVRARRQDAASTASTTCGRSRTSRCGTRSAACPASPRWRASAATRSSTRSPSIRTGCAPTA